MNINEKIERAWSYVDAGGLSIEESKSILELDDIGSKANLVAGDVIMTKELNIGVIHKCQEGGTGLPPSYAVRFMDDGVEKSAWWYSQDFKGVVSLSFFRQFMEVKGDE